MTRCLFLIALSSLICVSVCNSNSDDDYDDNNNSVFLPSNMLESKHIVVDIMIGTPARKYSLEVDPLQSGVTLGIESGAYSDYIRYGSAASTSYDGYRDIMSIESLEYFDNVTYIPESSVRTKNTNGVFGIGKASTIWRFFSSATFTVGGLVFGDMHPLIRNMQHASSPLVKCVHSHSPALCRFVGQIDNAYYAVELFYPGRKITVPPAVHDRYVKGQALFGPQSLETLQIVVKNNEDDSAAMSSLRCVEEYHAAGILNVQTCDGEFDIDVDPSMYVYWSGGIKRIAIAEETAYSHVGGNETLPRVTVPISMLAHMVVHMFITQNGTYLAISDYRTVSTQPFHALIGGFVLAIIYIMYRYVINIPDTSELDEIEKGMEPVSVSPGEPPKYPGEPNYTNVTVHARSEMHSVTMAVYEMTGYAIAAFILSPVGSLSVTLREHYKLSAFIFTVPFAVGSIGLLCLAYTIGAPVVATSSSLRVALIAMRRTSFEFVTLLALWASFIYFRTSDLGTFITMIISLILVAVLFRITFSFLFIFYVVSRHEKSGGWSWLSLFIVAVHLTLSALAVYFCYSYNVFPYCKYLFVVFTGEYHVISFAVVVVPIGYGMISAFSTRNWHKLVVSGQKKFVYYHKKTT